jgi:Uncharacterized protein conserved in bacteria
MSKVQSLTRELAKYALAKKGAQQDYSWQQFDPLKCPHLMLPGISWGIFFEVESRDDRHFAEIPVTSQRLKEHQALYPDIRESEWMERDGHVQMEVPLDGSVPVTFLKALIDDGYALIWNKLDSEARLKIELSGLPYDEPKLIDRLVEMRGLQEHRKAIRKLARPAILLRTKRSTESKIPLGATKIGGRPDLPRSVAWPVYQDGKPLAFLAQINLGEIAKLKSPIKGLPSKGLLSIFSAWGWMEDGDGGPQTPNSYGEGQKGWTAVIHTPPRAKLQRLKTPRRVNAFKAAAVIPTPILSLPNSRAEPPLAKLGLSDKDYERIDDMQSDFRSLQMSHWLGNRDSLASHHLLGGYALFQQEFPRHLLDLGLAMFLQIGTDSKTGMCWGDGGELTWYADPKALAKGRFERLQCEFQCG